MHAYIKRWVFWFQQIIPSSGFKCCASAKGEEDQWWGGSWKIAMTKVWTLFHLRSVFFASTQEDGSESPDSSSDWSESPDSPSEGSDFCEDSSDSDQFVSNTSGSRIIVGVPGILSWVSLLNILLLLVNVNFSNTVSLLLGHRWIQNCSPENTRFWCWISPYGHFRQLEVHQVDPASW